MRARVEEQRKAVGGEGEGTKLYVKVVFLANETIEIIQAIPLSLRTTMSVSKSNEN